MWSCVVGCGGGWHSASQSPLPVPPLARVTHRAAGVGACSCKRSSPHPAAGRSLDCAAARPSCRPDWRHNLPSRTATTLLSACWRPGTAHGERCAQSQHRYFGRAAIRLLYNGDINGAASRDQTPARDKAVLKQGSFITAGASLHAYGYTVIIIIIHMQRTCNKVYIQLLIMR